MTDSISDQIEDLERQIDKVNERCDEAWKNWNEEAYEGAVSTGNKLYAQLQELRKSLP